MGMVDVIGSFEDDVIAAWSLVDGDTPLQWSDSPNEAGAAPRITWDPTSAEHSPPMRMGGGAGDDGDLWLRKVSVTFEIWARSIDEADTLLGILVNAMHAKLTQRSYELGGEEWNTGDVANDGVQLKVKTVFRVPIARTGTTTVKLASIVPTATLTAPSV